jgi:hypothetical protein
MQERSEMSIADLYVVYTGGQTGRYRQGDILNRADHSDEEMATYADKIVPLAEMTPVHAATILNGLRRALGPYDPGPYSRAKAPAGDYLTNPQLRRIAEGCDPVAVYQE